MRGVNLLSVLLGLGLVASLSIPRVEADDAEGIAFFDQKIAPLLQQRCYKCHSHEAGKSSGGLVLDSKAGVKAGGISGVVVDPSAPQQSLLVKAIRREADVEAMPPDESLSVSEIALLVEWVQRGAPDSRESDEVMDSQARLREKAKLHWAFKPLSIPKDIQSIDQAVAKAIRERGVTPSPKAGPDALLQRMHFDLIGLPPTIDEVRAFRMEFQMDPDGAIRRAIDRLLANPHYGERMARVWMDLARYADISGVPKNQNRDDRLPFAFSYRDYLIRAFNSDKRFDQFVREQLAADQLTLDDPRDIAATGFLAVGSCAGTDDERIAERIDTVMQVFQGLTVGCARCHDHKFDPISTEDFYALRGVILSTEELGTGRVSERVDQSLCPLIPSDRSGSEYANYDAALRKAEEEFAISEEAAWVPKEKLWRGQTGVFLDIIARTDAERDGLSVRDYARNRAPIPVVVAWHDIIRRAERRFDPVFEPWVRLSKLPKENFSIAALETLNALRTEPRKVNRLVLDHLIASKLTSMRDVVAAYGTLFTKVTEQSSASQAFVSNELSDPEYAALHALLYSPGSPPCRSEVKVRDAMGSLGEKNRNLELRKLNDLRYHHRLAPIRTIAVRDAKRIQDSPVFVRGEADQRLPPVRRRFMSLVSDEKPAPFTHGSGRLEWAEAMVANGNPLTARVIANRVWQMHFGRPLVETPNDFGLQSPEPVQISLLDWLAAHLVANQWSLKSLHRTIMLSDVWQQASSGHPEYIQQEDVDGDNILLWRQNMRRLEFEQLRDRILQVSGALDRSVFGRSEPIYTQPGSARRTVYAMIDRTELPVLLTVYDVPDPNMTSGERYVTTVSPQSLFWMNNKFIDLNLDRLVLSEQFRGIQKPDDKLLYLFERILLRAPKEDERETLLSLLNKVTQNKNTVGTITAEERAWKMIAQTLLMTDEFSYLR